MVNLSPDWRDEIDERIQQIEQGEAEPVPWQEVEAQVRRTLGRG